MTPPHDLQWDNRIVQPPSLLQNIEANPTVNPLHRQEERIDPIIKSNVVRARGDSSTVSILL
jgi:hypothetical protein